METSDDDFVWTDASSDSSKDTNVDMTQNKSRQGSDVENGHSEPHSEPEATQDPVKKHKERKKRKKHVHEDIDNGNQVDRSVKSESNSDFDVPNRKKRHRNESTSSNHDQSLYDGEDYLNLRVKQENATFVEPKLLKTKKKKKKDEPKETEEEKMELSILSNNEMDIEESNKDSSCLVNGDYSEINETDVRRRKKKKKKKEKLSINNDTSDILHESEDSNKTKKKKKNKELLQNDASYNDNFQNDLENNDIISSTLIHNSIQENDNEQDNSIQNSTSVELTTKSTSRKSATIDKTLNKARRISDRLRFEEDSLDYEPKEAGPKHNFSKQLQQFINANANLKPLQVDLHSDPEISDDDDVWILKGPHDIAVEDFENINLTIDGTKKVKINENNYDTILDTTITTAPLLLFNNKKVFLKNMPLKGAISLRKRIPKIHIPYESLMINNESSLIPLPETKCRHPLFGINYKNVADIPPRTAEPLNSSEDLLGRHSKKKKKKHKERLNSSTSMSTSDVTVKPNIEELHLSKKSKGKKWKHEDDVSFEEKPNIEELHPNKMRKKMGLTFEDDTEFEIKPNIVDLQSNKKTRKQKETQEIETDKEETPSDDVPTKKKKKSNKKIKTEFDIETKPDIEVLHSKKKKRKHSDEKGESKKAKRARYDPTSAAAWESEQAIEENLFDF